MAAPVVSLKVKVALAAILSLVGGYVDVISIIKFQCFGSMMTGNLIQLARYGADPDLDGWAVKEDMQICMAAFIAIVIVVYMFGVMTYHGAEVLHKYGTTIIAPIGLVTISILQLSEYMGWTDGVIPTRWKLFPVALIFGIQNAMSVAGAVKAPTTLCTGHIGNICHAFQKALFGQSQHILWDRFALSSTVVISFLIGALMGQVAVKHTVDNWMQHFLLLPAMVVLTGAMVVDDMLSTERDDDSSLAAARDVTLLA